MFIESPTCDTATELDEFLIACGSDKNLKLAGHLATIAGYI